jgi:hypothetical protein
MLFEVMDLKKIKMINEFKLNTYGGEMLTFEKILPADSRTYTRARGITQPDSG